ncbi:MAG TPA: extracellular solute-binding protein [Candidatus Avipropionibacterium avicola]|uniref:Extracellular solute-binding protein n=1 Tax=Candidatus Avipropionibacterium avicola TaxID=2840701 RepID=A0A9D1GWI4_9ACTN|nr:extracellular solute-binding protein [Candidatus Avipropionibacterium avicola]
MRPISRRTALASAATLTATGLLASCGGAGGGTDTDEQVENPDENINAEGMPIVKEPITLTMMTRRSPNTAEDWNNVASMKLMQEQSNIEIDWGHIPWEQASEKRNLALASGDYPEIIHRTAMNSVDIAKYGEQGTLVRLNDAIDTYMPNLTAILAENPDFRAGLTFPDGNIYSLPTIYDPEFQSLNMQQKLWIRQDWLDEVDMDAPETLDEFEACLEAFQQADPAGGGKTIPFTTGSETLWIDILRSSFGVGNRGTAAGQIDADEGGRVRFWPASEQYRELIAYVSRLYSKKLVQQDVFGTDSATFNNLGKEGLLGAAATQAPSAFFTKGVGENYVSLAPMKKTDADEVPAWTMVGSGLQSIGQWVVTDKIEHLVESCRWMDYFYGDEGARLFFMGIEGESYEQTGDGEYDFTEKITDNPDGLTVDEALRPYVTYLGGSYPGIVKEAYFKGTESSAQARKGTEAVAPYKIDEVWPVFTFTAEEAAELSAITVDLTKLVSESRAKFITGEMSVDNDWEKYVSQFQQIGIDRYLEIQQAAYDRFKG